ncbi:hypothetical protein HWB57_gp099 [Erwinia phage vB_EamM-Bue1]|uniref:Uncharacterized protein n=1 Tax=Erwinia phage vB_EamM-Bue1 TaxID=2099338 RepID=A0A2P1JUB3_9CAUD|nr:hypothetical protein HWB57_gp099 [Erwinia phage vB_EamM-Bue1]AVO22939.1 hypothetical protein [Erwinia phage vB_EamM-Bue1]
MAITEDCMQVLARQLAGEMLLDPDVLFNYLGEEFWDTISDEDLEALKNAVARVGASCIRAAAGQVVGHEDRGTFQRWANMVALKSIDKGNLS